MTIRFHDLPPAMQARVGLQDKTAVKAKRSKYGNKRATRGALKFDSQKEARRYDALCLLRSIGSVAWFVRQPVFELPGGTTYRADYLVIWRLQGECGFGVTVEDVKVPATARDKTYRVKKREVEAAYGIVIEEV